MSPSREKLSILLINLNFSSNWLKSSHPFLLSCSPTFYAIGWKQFYLKYLVFLKESMRYELKKKKKKKNHSNNLEASWGMKWEKIASSFQEITFKNFVFIFEENEGNVFSLAAWLGFGGAGPEHRASSWSWEPWALLHHCWLLIASVSSFNLSAESIQLCSCSMRVGALPRGSGGTLLDGF